MKVENEFGGCPHCGQADGFLEEWRCYVFFCVQHKTRWIIGSDTFDSFHSSFKDSQREKWMKLGVKDYTLVDPIFDDTGLHIDFNGRLIHEGEKAMREAYEIQSQTLGDVDLGPIVKCILARVWACEKMLEDEVEDHAYDTQDLQGKKGWLSQLVLRE